MSTLVERILLDVLPAMELGRPPHILVLADPAAAICGKLVNAFPDVACCPDRQRAPGDGHRATAYASVPELLADDRCWDAVVLVEGGRRLREVHPPPRYERLMQWLAEHAGVVILEAPRRSLAPDLHDLGPYDVVTLLDPFAFVTEVEEFESESFSMSRPLLVASNAGAYVDGAWWTCEIEHPIAIDPLRPVQTLLIGDAVLKIERSSEDDFRRSVVRSEAAFLLGMEPHVRSALNLPEVTSLTRGRAVSMLTRTVVTGSSLSRGDCARGIVPVQEVLACAARWASAGLFHNDLRPWNLLWDGSVVTLIDYADAGPGDHDCQELPQVLALAMTLASLLTDDVPFGPEFLPAAMHHAQAAGVLSRWTLDEMREQPWLGLPDCLPDLTAMLSGMDAQPVEWVMRSVLDTVMAQAKVEVSR